MVYLYKDILSQNEDNEKHEFHKLSVSCYSIVSKKQIITMKKERTDESHGQTV